MRLNLLSGIFRTRSLIGRQIRPNKIKAANGLRNMATATDTK